MDPNEALKKAREASEKIGTAKWSKGELEAAAVDLMMYFDSLDKWMTDGGFPPVDWKRTGEPSTKFEGRRQVSPRGF